MAQCAESEAGPRGLHCGAEQICDIVRFMFVCKTLSDMAELLDQIRKSSHIEVVRFKDRIKNPSGGWRDAMINFCVKDSDYPHHICEVQIVHQKMALCRRKDGLGGHDEYARERNAREILEHLGLPQPKEEADTLPEQVEQLQEELKGAKEQLATATQAATRKIVWRWRSKPEVEPVALTPVALTPTGVRWLVRLLMKSKRNQSRVEPALPEASTSGTSKTEDAVTAMEGDPVVDP